MNHLTGILKFFFQRMCHVHLILKLITVSCILFAVTIASSQERIYKVPPSSQTNVRAPYISDTDMEQCVEIYNKATWLKQELENMQIDLAQPAQVDAYNSKVSLYSKMSNHYNTSCAGKDSDGALQAVQTLNQ